MSESYQTLTTNVRTLSCCGEPENHCSCDGQPRLNANQKRELVQQLSILQQEILNDSQQQQQRGGEMYNQPTQPQFASNYGDILRDPEPLVPNQERSPYAADGGLLDPPSFQEWAFNQRMQQEQGRLTVQQTRDRQTAQKQHTADSQGAIPDPDFKWHEEY